MDRRAWQDTARGVWESQTQLNCLTHKHVLQEILAKLVILRNASKTESCGLELEGAVGGIWPFLLEVKARQRFWDLLREEGSPPRGSAALSWLFCGLDQRAWLSPKSFSDRILYVYIVYSKVQWHKQAAA